MKDIKEIIANNLIDLRKKHHLTQNELAAKINYSDNAISRWERAEVTPSIETLVQISEVFDIPLSSLIEDNAVGVAKTKDKTMVINKLSTAIICVSIVWLIAVIAFVYGNMLFSNNLWMIFVWSVPASCIVLLPFAKYFGAHIYRFVVLSVLQWSLLASLYVQFIQYNMWLIFIIGVPIEIALSTYTFIKPKEQKKR